MRPPTVALVAAVAAILAATVAIRRVEIDGDSMRPTLVPGDRLLVVRARSVRPGDLALVVDPRNQTRTMVKRVASVSADGVVVVGDNPGRSTDSRTFGPVPTASVRGRVVYRYHPDDRRGRVGGL